MAKINRRKIQLDIEKTIIINLITSTEFCKNVIHSLNPEYFKTPAARTISKWVNEYYTVYENAPDNDIREIFNEKQEALDTEEAELIHNILEHLSSLDESQIVTNIEYATKKAKKYFNKRALELTSEKLQNALDKGNTKAAEASLVEHKKVLEGLSLSAVRGDSEEIINDVLAEAYYDDLPTANTLFRMSGNLGYFMGWLKRGWLIAFMGPMKRGKTFWLIELMFEAITNRKKVLFISLEMSNEEILDRFYKRVTGGFILESGKKLAPIFDCKLNQNDKCDKTSRVGTGKLLDEEGNIPAYEDSRRWAPCTACRGTRDFKPSSWYEQEKIKRTSYKKSKKHINSFNKIYANYYRVRSYPTYAAGIEDIEALLNVLEYTENFIPDVICIDYDALLKPAETGFSERGQVDHTWKNLRSLSGTRNCLVATATQSNRGSISKYVVEQIDSSEDIRKLAHVVAMYGLNQTDDEKERGVMRINTVAHRFKKFIQEKCVHVLQDFEFGQVHIDSE